MTREEALTKWVLPALQKTWNEKKVEEILKALEQEPCVGSDDCKEVINAYFEGQADTLDGIKAEIKEEADFAYADFERYKVECLGQDGEDAEDSLPQDDFRYGMLRALEIIEKHTSIGEDK